MVRSSPPYRLVIFEDTYRRDVVEFSCPSVGCAIFMAQSYRGDHPAELYQDGHWLGDLGILPEDTQISTELRFADR